MRLTFDQWLRILTLAGAVGSFAWGVWVWQDGKRREVEAAERESRRSAESRRIEATAPFLNRQLTLYTEATQTASIIANGSTGDAAVRMALDRFWQLYWGELALVEDRNVEGAMKEFGSALERGAGEPKLRVLALRLAHACRLSLDHSWGIDAWTASSTAQP